MKLSQDVLYMHNKETLTVFIKNDNGTFAQVQLEMKDGVINMCTNTPSVTKTFDTWEREQLATTIETETRNRVREYIDENGYCESRLNDLIELYNADKQFKEAVDNNYHLIEYDGWKHYQKIMGIEIPFKHFSRISDILWDLDIDVIDLPHNNNTLTARPLSFNELPKQAQDVITESPEAIENGESIVFDFNREDFEVYKARESCNDRVLYRMQKFI